MEHKIVGTAGGFLALCSCGEPVDDLGVHVVVEDVDLDETPATLPSGRVLDEQGAAELVADVLAQAGRALPEPDITAERLHAALLLAVLGTTDMHKVDETPLAPLEVARLLSERAIPDVINAMILAGWVPPSLRKFDDLADDPECQHESDSLDRTICGACDRMHYYCDACGQRTDSCDDD